MSQRYGPGFDLARLLWVDPTRQWGVPGAALASVFGRDARCWSRAWLACGRPSLVGITVTTLPQFPRDLVADEQRTRVAKPQVSGPTAVGCGCCLGGSVVEAAETVALETGYGACAQEAQALLRGYRLPAADSGKITISASWDDPRV